MDTVPIAFIQQCYLTYLADEINNWKDLSRPYGDVSHALTNKNISSTTISIEYKTHNSDITYVMYRRNSEKIDYLELLSPQNATSFRRLEIYACGGHDYLYDDVQVVKSTWDASDFRQKLKSARLYPIVDVLVAAPGYDGDCDTRILDTLKEVGVIINGRLYYRGSVSSFQEEQLINLLRRDSMHGISLSWNSITGTGWAGISLAFFESFT
ncbi:hypothetical protein L596_027115 [Steinernema carpocapsae]|uniref:Uncharacterized protein n=1 Tax=Steinernema carpocapsae TaxID=34508 RepID=A0A4U5M3G2_STECR|nr:hypothetical protein L596_027115 [Steinernema carpocapsae]